MDPRANQQCMTEVTRLCGIVIRQRERKVDRQRLNKKNMNKNICQRLTLSMRPSSTAATTNAQAPVPHARVAPAIAM